MENNQQQRIGAWVKTVLIIQLVFNGFNPLILVSLILSILMAIFIW